MPNDAVGTNPRNDYWREWQRRQRQARTATQPTIPCECECGTQIPAVNSQGKPARYAHGHNPRPPGFRKGHYPVAAVEANRRNAVEKRQERLLSRIAVIESRIDKSGECWRWTRHHHVTSGRPLAWYDGQMEHVYRILYRHYVGPIPDDLVLDHYKCNNHWCCNWQHVEPVTNAENVRRMHAHRKENGTSAERMTCKNGHPKELYYRVSPSGKSRWCTECTRLKMQRRRAG